MGLLGHCIILGVPFAIGVVVGIFAIAKLIEWIMNKWPLQTYWAILGLIISSPVAILMKVDWSTFSFLQLVIGIVACGAGCWCAAMLARKEQS